MAPRQSETHSRQAQVSAFPAAPRETFFQKVAAPVMVVLLSSLVVSLGSNWADDIRQSEIIRAMVGRIDTLEKERRIGTRFTGNQEIEMQRKYESMQAGITDLRILVAGMLAKQKR